jgi:hypothetical protein
LRIVAIIDPLANLHRPKTRAEFLSAVKAMREQGWKPRDICDAIGLAIPAVLDLIRELDEKKTADDQSLTPS